MCAVHPVILDTCCSGQRPVDCCGWLTLHFLQGLLRVVFLTHGVHVEKWGLLSEHVVLRMPLHRVEVSAYRVLRGIPWHSGGWHAWCSVL